MEPSSLAGPNHPAAERPDFREALRFWARLGFVSFGGPAGQIAILHRELVEKRRWISEDRFSAGLYVDRVQSLPRLAGALRAIGAAVTGVIASLGLDYGIAVLLPLGAAESPDLFALATILAAATALRLRTSLGLVLLAGVAIGLLHHFIS